VRWRLGNFETRCSRYLDVHVCVHACELPVSICSCITESAYVIPCGANGDREANVSLYFSFRSRPEGDGEMKLK